MVKKLAVVVLVLYAVWVSVGLYRDIAKGEVRISVPQKKYDLGEPTEAKLILPGQDPPTWILSKELIRKLSLKKAEPGRNALTVLGEDGEMYAWTDVLEAHMDWVEKRMRRQK